MRINASPAICRILAFRAQNPDETTVQQLQLALEEITRLENLHKSLVKQPIETSGFVINPSIPRDTQGRRERPEALEDEGRGSLRKRQAPVCESEGGPSKRRQTASPDPSPVKPSSQDLATARPAPIPNPFLAAPVPAPTLPIRSPSKPTLASVSSRPHPLFKLFAESDCHPGSAGSLASPGPRAASEAVPTMLSETIEAAKREREQRALPRGPLSSVVSPGTEHAHQSLSVSSVLPVRPTASRPVTSSCAINREAEDLPSSFLRRQTNTSGRVQGAAEPELAASGATPITTTTATPSQLVAAPISSAAPVRRSPLGPSTAQAAVGTTAFDRVEGVYEKKVRGVLSTDERKSFRQLLKAYDHSASATRRVDLVQGLHALFLHEKSLRTPVSMDAKDREERREVLMEVKGRLGLK